MNNHAMQLPLPSRDEVLDPRARAFYHRGLKTLREARIPFLVGGAYAFECYTSIVRYTKDLDIFVYARDCDRTLVTLAQAGCHTDLTFPHWLGKAFCGEYFIDIIFSSGNGACPVDDEWFEHAVGSNIFTIPVSLCPPEEIIWSKAFVEERERYDGADIAHLLRACSTRLSWPRLLRRFDPHWRVLLSHLVLFGFVYPAERDRIPEWVMQELLYRLSHELQTTPPDELLCQGTLLSREQYLTDTLQWGYEDARLLPKGTLTQEEVDRWTAAIEKK